MRQLYRTSIDNVNSVPALVWWCLLWGFPALLIGTEMFPVSLFFGGGVITILTRSNNKEKITFGLLWLAIITLLLYSIQYINTLN